MKTTRSPGIPDSSAQMNPFTETKFKKTTLNWSTWHHKSIPVCEEPLARAKKYFPLNPLSELKFRLSRGVLLPTAYGVRDGRLCFQSVPPPPPPWGRGRYCHRLHRAWYFSRQEMPFKMSHKQLNLFNVTVSCPCHKQCTFHFELPHNKLNDEVNQKYYKWHKVKWNKLHAW